MKCSACVCSALLLVLWCTLLLACLACLPFPSLPALKLSRISPAFALGTLTYSTAILPRVNLLFLLNHLFYKPTPAPPPSQPVFLFFSSSPGRTHSPLPTSSLLSNCALLNAPSPDVTPSVYFPLFQPPSSNHRPSERPTRHQRQLPVFQPHPLRTTVHYLFRRVTVVLCFRR
jgi:hypothetical protein